MFCEGILIFNLFYFQSHVSSREAITQIRITNSLIQRTTEAALRRCSQEKVFWKYAANLQENTYAEYLQDLDKFI